MTPEFRRRLAEKRAEWEAHDAAFSAMVARREARLRAWDEHDRRRRARLRRLTFGLLGR